MWALQWGTSQPWHGKVSLRGQTTSLPCKKISGVLSRQWTCSQEQESFQAICVWNLVVGQTDAHFSITQRDIYLEIGQYIECNTSLNCRLQAKSMLGERLNLGILELSSLLRFEKRKNGSCWGSPYSSSWRIISGLCCQVCPLSKNESVRDGRFSQTW